MKMNVRNIAIILFHIGACVLFFVPIGWYLTKEEFFLGRWPALTYWNLWIQVLYFGFATLIDALRPTCFKYSCAIKARDKMYASIVFPLTCFVFTLFWSLYLIDRDLIFPVEAELHNPPWANHIAHTAIFPVALIEMWLVKHRYPRQMDGLMITALFGVMYLTWILLLFVLEGHWPYGIIEMLHPGYRVLLFSGCIAALAIFYLIGEKLNRLFWSQIDSQTEFAKKAFGENEKGSPLLEVEFSKTSDAQTNDDRSDVLTAVASEEATGAESAETKLLRSPEQGFKNLSPC